MKVLITHLSIFTALTATAHAVTDAATLGLHNESEVGVVVTSGNAPTNTFNFRQLNTYGWDLELVRFNARFLKTSTRSAETAKNWALGLRYERELAEQFGLYFGQAIESDPFAGYFQRYNTDAGGKYFLLKEDALVWTAEAGYRYTIENRRAGDVNQSYLRFYTEASRAWTKTFSTKLWVEYLPNMSDSSDYQLNTEASANAAISDLFAIKLAYLIRNRGILVAPATEKTDAQFSTALVAKF
jgi:putative salt-induced outer membrane protein